MKYGINLLLWTDRMHDGLMPVLEQVKAMGYEGVEMPMFELNEPLYADWGKRLDGLALERTAVTIRGAGDNPISPSAGVRAAAVDAMKKTIDCCQAAGVSLLADPDLYAHDSSRAGSLARQRSALIDELSTHEENWLALSAEYEEGMAQSSG